MRKLFVLSMMVASPLILATVAVGVSKIAFILFGICLLTGGPICGALIGGGLGGALLLAGGVLSLLGEDIGNLLLL